MIIGQRHIESKTTTQGGYPLPLTGKPLTKTPVVAKLEGVPLKDYPEVFIPGQEQLAEDGMRGNLHWLSQPTCAPGSGRHRLAGGAGQQRLIHF